jgi:hypothetical protein
MGSVQRGEQARAHHDQARDAGQLDSDGEVYVPSRALPAERPAHGMSTRRKSGVILPRRCYQDEDSGDIVEQSPALCPLDALGPATPFPDPGAYAARFVLRQRCPS